MSCPTCRTCKRAFHTRKALQCHSMRLAHNGFKGGYISVHQKRKLASGMVLVGVINPPKIVEVACPHCKNGFYIPMEAK